MPTGRDRCPKVERWTGRPFRGSADPGVPAALSWPPSVCSSRSTPHPPTSCPGRLAAPAAPTSLVLTHQLQAGFPQWGRRAEGRRRVSGAADPPSGLRCPPTDTTAPSGGRPSLPSPPLRPSPPERCAGSGSCFLSRPFKPGGGDSHPCFSYGFICSLALRSKGRKQLVMPVTDVTGVAKLGQGARRG